MATGINGIAWSPPTTIVGASAPWRLNDDERPAVGGSNGVQYRSADPNTESESGRYEGCRHGLEEFAPRRNFFASQRLETSSSQGAAPFLVRVPLVHVRRIASSTR